MGKTVIHTVPPGERLSVVKEWLSPRTTVDPVTGCWKWTGPKARGGYGDSKALARRLGYRRIPRAAWVAFYGAIPDGLLVLHRCDNPACWNPAHLFLGTSHDNSMDMSAKGRAAKQNPTHCIHGHELTPDNVIVSHGSKGQTYRHCRICKNAISREVKRRRRAKAKLEREGSDGAQ